MKETFTIDSNHKFLRSNCVATCVVLKHNLGPNMLYLKVFLWKLIQTIYVVSILSALMAIDICIW